MEEKGDLLCIVVCCVVFDIYNTLSLQEYHGPSALSVPSIEHS
jgi:hypothetical protein